MAVIGGTEIVASFRIGASSAVASINGLTGAVIIAAGTGITLTPAGNTITIASAGLAATGVVQVAAVQLSAAQMLALNTTPVTLIAAPGSGFAIIPIHVGFREHFVSAAYVVTGANLSILYANGQSPANGMGSFGSGTGVLDQTSSRSKMFAATATSGITVNSNADNQALQVQNVGTAYTTGDGLVTFVVDYMIVPSSL